MAPTAFWPGRSQRDTLLPPLLGVGVAGVLMGRAGILFQGREISEFWKG